MNQLSLNKPHPVCTEAMQILEKWKPDAFEIYCKHQKSTKIDSKNQKLDSLSHAEDVSLSIRIIQNKRLGFSFTTSLDRSALEKTVQTAIEMAKLMREDPLLAFHSFKKTLYPTFKAPLYDSVGLTIPLTEKIQMAYALEAHCRKTDPRVVGVRSASLSETETHVSMLDSEGTQLYHASTGYTSSILCKAEANGESQMGGDFAFSHCLNTLPLESVSEEAAHTATELLGAIQAPTLQCSAILRNSVVAEFLDFLSASFSAEQIDKGKSLFVGKLGHSLFSKKITLIDDGLLEDGAGTQPFDSEGVASQKTLLFDSGVLSHFLYDLTYARKHHTQPTGSTSRDLKSPPSISYSNLFMKEGTHSPENLIKNLHQGILITDLMGVHTANPVTGHFSLGASGILIEKGRLTQPVKGFAVTGNIFNLFKQVTEVGQDLKFFGKIGAPSLCIDEISIGGS